MTLRAHAAGVFAGILLWTGAAIAQEAQSLDARKVRVEMRVLVMPPRATSVYRSVDAGVREWWAAEIAANDAEVIGRHETAAASAAVLAGATRPHFSADAPALAKHANATHVALTELRYEKGHAEVWLRVFDASGKALAAGNAKGKLARLGDVLVQASAPARKLFGGVPPEAPRLSELGAFETAGDALAAARPADAIASLSGAKGRTADSLRAEIDGAASDERVPLPERSKLASVTGNDDPNWLRVRQGIIEGKDPELLLAGAVNASSRGEHVRALELFRQVEAAAPDARARLGIARELTALDRHAEAQPAWEAVLADTPESFEARSALSRNPSLPPAKRAEHAFALGELKARVFDREGAEKAFEHAAQLAPKESSIRAKLGVARMQAQLGEREDALLAYEELGAAGPQALGEHAASTYAGLGDVRALAGDDAGASEAYTSALAADPQNVDALSGQGEMLMKAGKPQEALSPLEQAARLQSQIADRQLRYAQALRATGDEEGALAALQASMVPEEEQAVLLREAADIQHERGDAAAAAETLQKAVALEPDDAPLRTALAEAYEETGNADAAARERARVSALTGITPTDARATARKPEEKSREGAPGGTFASVAAGFPPGRADGSPFAGVAFIGVTQQLSFIDHVRGWLLPRTLDAGALEADLRAAFEARYGLTPPGVVSDLVRPAYERVRTFSSTDRSDLSLVNDELGVEVSFVAQLKPVEPTAIDSPLAPESQIELRMHSGRTTDAVEILRLAASVPKPESYLRWNPRALVPYGILLALALAPFIRGWGKLNVRLEFEARKSTKGFFTIEISRSPGQAKREKEKTGASKLAQYQKRGAAWSRFRRFMAQRDNAFKMIPARSYYVCVHGVMQDEKGEIVGSYLEERRVKIPRGGTLDVSFDFRPREAALEVRLVRPEGDTNGVARVCVRGMPATMRFVKEETTTLYVSKGEHFVVVGYGDCVFERRVAISELTAHQVTVGLVDPQQAVFQGVKEAIEPFLLGDLAACARALDKAGMTTKAAELRAQYHEQQGDKAAAAKFYREAGQLTQAAALSAESGGNAQSAELYEQAGDHRSAASAYLEAGEFQRAAEMFEAAYDFGDAIEAYRKAGTREKVCDLLERVGRHHEAGVLSLELGDEDRAIRNLQQVDLRDPDYAESCRALADLFLAREEWVLAIDRFKEAIHTVGEDAAPLELFEQLGDAFEKNGDLQDALQTFEGIRKRDYQYANIADRIRSLRERTQLQQTQRQSQLNTAAAGATTMAEGAATLPSAAAEERYEILGELGRGGMGIVFKARDRRLGRVVALKRLPENLRDHPTAVALFLREAQSAAALNHPNIVTIYDADQAAGNYYLTMEFLEGLPLDAILKKRGSLSPKDAARMGVQIATGLQFAHERGIVHRDIKTANLFFTRDRVVKIMDFGLAKMVEEVRKAATVVGGTPYYMAPEQALGERVDHRADLYAFGVTLFELLTGRVPFRDGDVTYHHRHTAPPDLRDLVPGIPEALATLIERLMAKKAANRPATTAEVTAALDALVRG
jgi:tetratricopeptide (TPR) repeat protein